MKVAIVANGELENHPRLQTIWQIADLRIAADGGALNARQHLQLAPQIIIGDLDSLDDATRTWCKQAHAEFIQHPQAKDETDLELAIDLAIARGANEITILGAIGGRFDQTIANTLLLTKPAQVQISARLVSAKFEAWLATERATITGNIGDTVSLIPITPRVEGIVTNGLQYPLRNETLILGSPRGVSNRLIAERAEVVLAHGLLLIVHLKNTI
jgi:thiamine pyrophosphokinase